MRFKLDENLSRQLKPRLQALGHDACTVGDEGLLSQPDRVIADAAKKENRILMTLDGGFANLKKYPPGSHPGILLFRPPGPGLKAINDFIEKFIRTNTIDNAMGCLIIIEPARVRIRRPKDI